MKPCRPRWRPRAHPARGDRYWVASQLCDGILAAAINKWSTPTSRVGPATRAYHAVERRSVGLIETVVADLIEQGSVAKIE